MVAYIQCFDLFADVLLSQLLPQETPNIGGNSRTTTSFRGHVAYIYRALSRNHVFSFQADKIDANNNHRWEYYSLGLQLLSA